MNRYLQVVPNMDFDEAVTTCRETSNNIRFQKMTLTTGTWTGELFSGCGSGLSLSDLLRRIT